jgi:hypothetical protein
MGDAAAAAPPLDAAAGRVDVEVEHEGDAMPSSGVDSAAPSDATVLDSAAVVEHCDPNPCQRGGSCADGSGGFRCECPAGSTGARCELEICGETTILSRASLDAAKLCAEVHGKLSISSVGLASLTPTDLPHLTRVTGDLVVGALAGAERAPLLETITLAQLQRVEGTLLVGGNVRGSVRELHLPALTSIGSDQDAAPRLRMLQTESVVVDFPVLATVNGSVEIRDFSNLCTFKVAALTRITGTVFLSNIPNVPAATFAPLRAAAQGTVMQNLIGCCSLDSVGCSEFTAQTRDMYCGC